MTAEETYNERRQKINNQISTLKSLLNKKDKQFQKNKNDWGYTGDLVRISNLFDEIIESMKGVLE
jgi:sugar-specific transcriptional regulator TrmB